MRKLKTAKVCVYLTEEHEHARVNIQKFDHTQLWSLIGRKWAKKQFSDE